MNLRLKTQIPDENMDIPLKTSKQRSTFFQKIKVQQTSKFNTKEDVPNLVVNGSNIPQNQQNDFIQLQSSNLPQFYQQKSEPQQNIRYGDIVCLSFLTPKGQKGIIIGDGIANKKLECIPGNNIMIRSQFLTRRSKSNMYQYPSNSYIDKDSQQAFRKCLFQIVNKKQYYYQEVEQDLQQQIKQLIQQQKKLKQFAGQTQSSEKLVQTNLEQIQQIQSILDSLETYIQEEKEENEKQLIRMQGQPLLYEKEFQLRHVYSKHYLRINVNELSNQNLSSQITLEEQDDAFCNFKIISTNKAGLMKQSGDPIQYNESLQLVSSKDNRNRININTSDFQILEDGLEVNCSKEQGSNITIEQYQALPEKVEDYELSQQFLQEGNIVIFKNKELGKMALRRMKSIDFFLKNRQVFLELEEENISDQLYLELEQYITNQADSVSLYLNQEQENSFECLWEVQVKGSSLCQRISYQQPVLLRHVATGLYLRCKDEDAAQRGSRLITEDQSIYSNLTLTFDYTKKGCLFCFRPRNNQLNNNFVKLGDVFGVCSFNDNRILYCNNSAGMGKLKYISEQMLRKEIGFGLSTQGEESQQICSILLKTQQENTTERQNSLFILQRAESDLIFVADRIASLYQYLVSFYIFLQDWGFEYEKREVKFNFKKAYEEEKYLVQKSKILFKCIENLINFLSNEELQTSRQNTLMQSGLMQIVVVILQLSNWTVFFGNNMQLQNYYSREIYFGHAIKYQLRQIKHNNKKNNQENIANSILKPHIKQLYYVLRLFIINNLDTTKWLLLQRNKLNQYYINFFQEQIVYCPNIIKDFLRLLSLQIEEDSQIESDYFIKFWMDKFSEVTQDNVESQCFYLQMLQNYLKKKKSDGINYNFAKSIYNSWFVQDHKVTISFDVIKDRPVIKILNENSRFVILNQKFCLIYERIRTKYQLIENEEKYYIVEILFVNPYVEFDLNEEENINKENKNEIQLQDIQIQNINEQPGPQDIQLRHIISQEEMQIIQNNIYPSGVFYSYRKYFVECMLIFSYLIQEGFDLNSLNLNLPFIQTVFTIIIQDQYQHIPNLPLLTCIINLYQSTQVYKYPLIRVTQNKSNCYFAKDVKEFDFKSGSTPSCQLFKNIYMEQDHYKKIQQEIAQQPISNSNNANLSTSDPTQILQEYAKKIVQTETQKGVTNYFIRWILDSERDHFFTGYHQCYKKITDEQYQIKQKMLFYLAIINLIRTAIDLGYYDTKTCELLIDKIPLIFQSYIGKNAKYNQINSYDYNQEQAFNEYKDTYNYTFINQKANNIKHQLIIQQHLMFMEEAKQADKSSAFKAKYNLNQIFKLPELTANSRELNNFNFLQNYIARDLLTCQNIDMRNAVFLETLHMLETLFNLQINLTAVQENQRINEEIKYIFQQKQQKQQQELQEEGKKDYILEGGVGVRPSSGSNAINKPFNTTDFLQYKLERQQQKKILQKLTERKLLSASIAITSAGAVACPSASNTDNNIQDKFPLIVFYLLFILKSHKQHSFIKNELSSIFVKSINSYQQIISIINEILIIDDEYDYFLMKQVYQITENYINQTNVDWLIYLESDSKTSNTGDASNKSNTKVGQHQVNQQLQQTLMPQKYQPQQQLKLQIQPLHHNADLHKKQDIAETEDKILKGIKALIELFKLPQYQEKKYKEKVEYIYLLQNILRNFEIIGLCLKLVNYCLSQGRLTELSREILTLLSLLVNKNSINAEILKPHLLAIMDFTQLVPDSVQSKLISVNKLVLLIINKDKHGAKIHDFIDKLTQKMNQIDVLEEDEDFVKRKVRIFAMIQYIKLMRNFCKAELQFVQQNQLKILSLLIQQPLFQELIALHKRELVHSEMRSEINKEGSILSDSQLHQDQEEEESKLGQEKQEGIAEIAYYKIRLYEKFLLLLCTLVHNSRLGIHLIKMQIPLRKLKILIIQQRIPLYIKKGLIKLLFELYINRISDYQLSASELVNSNQIDQLVPSKVIALINKFEQIFLDDEMYKELLVSESSPQQRSEARMTQSILGVCSNDTRIRQLHDNRFEVLNFFLKGGMLHFLIDCYEILLHVKSEEKLSCFQNVHKKLILVNKLFNSWLESQRSKLDSQIITKWEKRVNVIQQFITILGTNKLRNRNQFLQIIFLYKFRNRLETPKFLKLLQKSILSSKRLIDGCFHLLNKDYNLISKQVIANFLSEQEIVQYENGMEVPWEYKNIAKSRTIRSNEVILMELMQRFIVLLQTELSSLEDYHIGRQVHSEKSMCSSKSLKLAIYNWPQEQKNQLNVKSCLNYKARFKREKYLFHSYMRDIVINSLINNFFFKYQIVKFSNKEILTSFLNRLKHLLQQRYPFQLILLIKCIINQEKQNIIKLIKYGGAGAGVKGESKGYQSSSVHSNGAQSSYSSSSGYKRYREKIHMDNFMILQNERELIANLHCIQSACMGVGLHRIAIVMASHGNKLEKQLEAINFLNELLCTGNREIHDLLFNDLQKNEFISVQLFQLIKSFFNDRTQDIISQVKVQKQKKFCNTKDITKFNDYIMFSKAILKMIELLFENYHQEFQQYILTFVKKKQNIDILQDLINYALVILQEEVFEENDKFQIFNYLINTIQKMCISNQHLILFVVKSQKIIVLITGLMLGKQIIQRPLKVNKNEHGQNELTEDGKNIQKNIDMFSICLGFLKILIMGNNDKECCQYIIQHIRITDFIQILYDIYQTQVKEKESCFCCGGNGDGGSGNIESSSSNKKKTPGGSVNQRGNKQLLTIAFNIFIILKYLQSLFPDDTRLQNFEYSRIVKVNKKIQQEQMKYQILSIEKPIPRQPVTQQKNKGGQKVVTVANNNGSNSVPNNVNMYVRALSKTVISKRNSQGQGTILINTNQYDRSNKRDLSFANAVQVIEQRSHSVDQMTKGKQNTTIHSNLSMAISSSEDYIMYYQDYVCTVEIVNKDKKMDKIYFTKPECARFLTPGIKHHLIYKSNREMMQERLEFLVENTEFYERQMQYQQKLYSFKLIYFLINLWRSLRNWAIVVIFLINIFNFITYEDVFYEMKYPALIKINEALKIVQMVITIYFLVSCVVEKFPISFQSYKSSIDIGKKKKINLKSLSGSSQFEIKEFLVSFLLHIMSSENDDKYAFLKQFFFLFFDYEVLYCIMFLVIEQVAFYYRISNWALSVLFYALLNFDIVRISHQLRNIIKSFTMNKGNLYKFTIFGIMVVYIYSIIIYIYFNDQWEEEENNFKSHNNFLASFLLIFKEGIRKAEGISAAFKAANPHSPDYWSRYALDISFFILINVLFINVIFSIIVDTFGQLREELNEKLKKIKNRCFICGKSKQEIDLKIKEGWNYHIQHQHNVYHMLFFIIYCTNKELNDCDTNEKYVKSCLSNPNAIIQFFPINRCYELEYFKKQ